MKFVFVRHGQATSDDGLSKKESRLRELTDKGKEDARLAGEFLAGKDIRPDLVVTTHATRAKVTAKILLEVLGKDCPIFDCGSAFGQGTDLPGVLKKIDGWIKAAGVQPNVLLLVGHNPQQGVLISKTGKKPKIPRKHKGCVLVYDIDDNGDFLLGPYTIGQ